MENDKALQVFDFNEKIARVIMRGGDPWRVTWIAKDVCDVLELTNPTKNSKGA